LDCSLSTPTLLHHDTAAGDDVRMSAGLPAAKYRSHTPCALCHVQKQKKRVNSL